MPVKIKGIFHLSEKYISNAFFALHMNYLFRDQVQWAKSWRSSQHSFEFGFLNILVESETTEMQNLEFKDNKSRTDPLLPLHRTFCLKGKKGVGVALGGD